MFLLARLYLESLLDKRTKAKVLSTLASLSRGRHSLNEAYEDAVNRIDSQLPEDGALAKRTIGWLSYAKWPLRTEELCHALAVTTGDNALDKDNIPDVEDIVSICAGLVVVDHRSNIIRLVHYTIQEFFEKRRLGWHPRAEVEIASSLLTYLSFDVFQTCAADESPRALDEIRGVSTSRLCGKKYWVTCHAGARQSR
jgi:hypothetical protein